MLGFLEERCEFGLIFLFSLPIAGFPSCFVAFFFVAVDRFLFDSHLDSGKGSGTGGIVNVGVANAVSIVIGASGSSTTLGSGLTTVCLCIVRA